MAECTPYARAAYDAAETTPRSFGRPPTTTALPRSEGSYSSSTDTKDASMSTWKKVLATGCPEDSFYGPGGGPGASNRAAAAAVGPIRNDNMKRQAFFGVCRVNRRTFSRVLVLCPPETRRYGGQRRRAVECSGRTDPHEKAGAAARAAHAPGISVRPRGRYRRDRAPPEAGRRTAHHHAARVGR